MGAAVFSAHAEVVPHCHDAGEGCCGILRARGGSSSAFGTIAENMKVFSAHAEVVPVMTTPTSASTCILRARGGSSINVKIRIATSKYSPRTRR